MLADTTRWSDRVIPLPKDLSVDGSARLKASDVRVVCDVEPDPALRTAIASLSRFALGDEKSRFELRLVIERLSPVPNADQAYVIRPSQNGKGLVLAANTSVGLLYAARTLEQLVNPPTGIGPDTALEIPLVRITDWPDIAERGQWGGDAWRHLGEFSELKLNVLELDACVGLDGSGRAQAGIRRDLIAQGRELGVKIVPYILHLEQLSKHAGVSERADIVSKPDPSKPLPSDYTPGLCMSSPAARKLVRDWLNAVAAIPGVTDITVWLSEERAPCFCDRCMGEEPYELEVEAIVEGFREVRAEHPNARLRLLTTQGSYPVNDKILAAAPPDVGIIYYDGLRTYDSSRKPMIYPLLEEAAKSGRWIGVYPQVTHCWRTVWPWTAPQFVRYRAREFASKKLSNVIGYAVPSNFHHAFNIAALADWAWNSEGRSPEEFARVYAAKNGFADPDLFSQWAVMAGDAGWSLAESWLMLYVIYSPSLDLAGGAPFAERFKGTSILNDSELEKAIRLAQEALSLAQRAQDPDMISESRCVLAGLRAFQALKNLSSIRTTDGKRADASGQPADLRVIAGWLDVLDESSQTIRSEIIEWGERVRARSGGRSLPGRLCDTAFALLRTCDAYRKRGVEMGIADPHPDRRLKTVRGWTQADFEAGQQAVLMIDLGDLVPAEGGKYQVGLDFLDSANG
ncbi:MAG: glycoside hydrolase family 20 zincin-like fold domain-containing protein, partial [Armatimonadota bacterium]